MPPKKKAYKHFGGREPGKDGAAIPLEADLTSWASFSPVQAQAFLVSHLANVYEQTRDSRKELMRSKELFGSPIKRHNKHFKTGQDKYITVFKLSVSPMQLLVQQSFCKAKACPSQQSPHYLAYIPMQVVAY